MMRRRIPPHINRDGTVRRGNGETAAQQTAVQTIDADISVFVYYILKLVFFVLCIALAIGAAASLSYLGTFIFSEVHIGIRGVIRMLIPLLSFLVAVGRGCSYVVRSVTIWEWRRIFYAPIVTLVGFLGAGVLLFLFDWSMNRWWTLVLFCILFFVGISVFREAGDD